MRVLHLVTSLNSGGIERWLVGMLPHLGPVEVGFYCRRAGDNQLEPTARAHGAEVHYPKHENLASYARSLPAIVRDGRYDVVNNHLSIHSGLASARVRGTEANEVVSFHNAAFAPMRFGSRANRAMARQYARASLAISTRNAKQITFGSEDIAEGIAKITKPRPDKGVIVNYGVKVLDRVPDPSVGEQLRSTLGLDGRTQLVLNVARFNAQKNHAGIVAIGALLIERRPDTHVLLVGDGPELEPIKHLVTDRGLDANFHFLGRRNDTELLSAGSDVFLFPSFFEGLPVAALEAGANGLPMVGSDVPGVRLAVAHESTGYLVPVDDHQGFADAVIRILDDQALRSKLANTAVQRAAELFSREASTKKMIDVYELASRV